MSFHTCRDANSFVFGSRNAILYNAASEISVPSCARDPSYEVTLAGCTCSEKEVFADLGSGEAIMNNVMTD